MIHLSCAIWSKMSLNDIEMQFAADQMLLSMKNSWMKMHPNGSIPPISIPGTVRMYMDWSGIWRGIWLVRTGCSIA